MRNRLLFITIGCGLFVQASAASAQYGFPTRNLTPQRGPAWSPYLNLFRRGNSPTFNYFSLVKPELEFRKNFKQIDRQFGSVDQNIQSLNQQQAIQGPSLLPATGHSVGFMTHSRYFMTFKGGGSTPGSGVSAPPVSRFNRPASTGSLPASSRFNSMSRTASPSTNTPRR